MKRIGKMLVVILAAGLLAAVGSMFNPRTAHALVAALVQVSNTAAAPAITLDVSRLASQNVELVCGSSVGTRCFQFLPDGSVPETSPPSTYIVPAGSSLVITTVQLATNAPGSAALSQISPTIAFQPLRESYTFASAGSFQFQYPSGIVFSSGSTPFVNTLDTSQPEFLAFLSGYLVNAP
jgi:hypothetical protein